MKIVVFGAGGVGGYFGGCLIRAGRDVQFIARGPHLDAMLETGLRVHDLTDQFTVEVRATHEPASIGPADIVIVSVKTTDNDAVDAALPHLVGADTVVLSLQNGVDSESRFGDVVGHDRIMGAVTFIMAAIDGPGVVRRNPGPAKILFGETDGSRSDRTRAVRDALAVPGIEVQVRQDITSALWNKMSFICAVAGMTAASRQPVGRIRSTAAGRAMLRRISEEVCTVARAEGVELPAGTPDDVLTVVDGMDAEAQTSLHYDLVNGKPMELDALHGAVIRKAKRHGLAVPMNEAVYAVLSPSL